MHAEKSLAVMCLTFRILKTEMVGYLQSDESTISSMSQGAPLVDVYETLGCLLLRRNQVIDVALYLVLVCLLACELGQ
jgi:hypothetical protein